MVFFNSQSSISKHLHARRAVWAPAMAVLLFVAVYLPLASTLVRVSTPQDTVASAEPKLVKTTTPAPTAESVVAATTSTSAAKAPNCTPLSFANPAQQDLTNTANGLSVRADNTAFYHIYGNTADELRSQIQRCAPSSDGSSSAEFTGETAYSLGWQYDVATTADGSCTPTNVKVGLHTAIALPYWQPTGSATSGLSGRWQKFIASLTTHEQGHVAIDQRYAAMLVTDLNTMQPVDCTQMTGAVNSIINTDVQALNQANNTYDATTDHGGAQGAVLPSH